MKFDLNSSLDLKVKENQVMSLYWIKKYSVLG